MLQTNIVVTLNLTFNCQFDEEVFRDDAELNLKEFRRFFRMQKF